MTDRYAVFGNPIAHSKSPAIHAEFARQTGQDLSYEAILAPLDGFEATVETFRVAGGKGGNVTVPFKERAYALATRRTARAEAAGAVNTLKFDDDGILGDNTDGVGLVADLTRNLGVDLSGRRILLMGAGGAARGVLLPLLEGVPAEIFVVNRTAEKAVEMVAQFGSRLEAGATGGGPGFRCAAAGLQGGGYEGLAGRQFDLVVNATAAGLAGEMPPLPEDIFIPGALAYDMMYGRETPFMAFARARGVRASDGLGMLVEQAAAAFFVWRGVRPGTAPVIAMLRGQAKRDA